MATVSLPQAFNVWQPNYEIELAAKLAKGAKGSKVAPAYYPVDEAPPDMLWYRLDKQAIDAQVLDMAGKVLDRLSTARVDDRELIALRKAANELKVVKMLDAKDVAIVGQQGMGKSLLINALLHRRDLSKTSAVGGACTASAIKYIHKPGADDLGDRYDAAIQFMDDISLEEIIKEHARRYYQFHFGKNNDEMYRDEEERSANTARDFFAMVMNAANDKEAEAKLGRLLSVQHIENGKLMRVAAKRAALRMEEAGADENRTKQFHDMEILALMEQTQNYVAQHEEGLPSLWPIVQYVQVFMGSALLKNGVSIIDLPGLGDLNHSRTAATNAIRRQAGFEIIVAKSDRVTTEEVVDQQLKQAIRTHGARNTILVLTKIDEFFLDNHSIESIIRHNKNEPFLTIRSHLKEIEALFSDADEKIRQACEDEDDDEADIDYLVGQVDALQNYQEYLIKFAQVSFVQQRATDLENDMRLKYMDLDPDPIHVFSVSASMYIDWMKKRQKERPILTPEMTGIPKLRQFLLGISTGENLEVYRHHIVNKLPAFLDRVERVVDSEHKDDAYAVIRPKFTQLVVFLKNEHQAKFVDYVENSITRLWGAPSAKAARMNSIADTVRDWSDGNRWQTYNKALREQGIVKKTQCFKYRGKGCFNWNEELSLAIQPDIIAWRCKMETGLMAIANDLSKCTKQVCKDALTAIKESSLAPPLKFVALEEWNKHQCEVLTQCSKLAPFLLEHVATLYKEFTTETDTRSLIAKLNAATYETVQKTPNTGGGWYQKQQKNMMSAMVPASSTVKTLLDKIADHVDRAVNVTLVAAFSEYMHELVRKLELFDEHIGERLPPDYELLVPDHRIRDALKSLLPELHMQMQGLVEPFSVPEAQVKREWDFEDLMDNVNLESPTKRTKFNVEF